MKPRRDWKVTLALCLAAAAALLGATGTFALGAQAGPFMWSPRLGFAESHDQRAFNLVQANGAKAPIAAWNEASEALQLAPYLNSARLRLAYLDTLQNGAMRERGRRLIAQSYDLVPYDHTVAAWRVGFALEHWAELTPELRVAVQAEAKAFLGSGSRDVNMAQVLASKGSREGRLAAALWLRTTR